MAKKNNNRFFIVVLLTVVAVAGWKIHRNLTTVTVQGDELQTLLAGNRLKSKAFEFSFGPDGYLSGTMRGYNDKGRWTIVDDEVCLRWETWSTGITSSSGNGSCWQLRRYGETLELLSSSSGRGSEVVWLKGERR